jgi:hypothetical protein
MNEFTINGKNPCDNACPNSFSDEASNLQNLGCLPNYFDVQKMLEQGEVWMCHSNPQKVCSAVGSLDPTKKYTNRTEY